jgi:hypothetical protein
VSFGLRGLRRDEGGAVAIILGLTLSGLVGFAALAVEGAQWYATYRSVRTAVDAAAISGAVAYAAGDTSGYSTEATAVAARNGYIDGTNSVTVAIHRPPSTGPNTANNGAIEIIITAPQTPRLAALFYSSSVNISARAVAGAGTPSMCGLALGSGNTTTVRLSGGAHVTLNQCGLGVNSTSTSSLTVSGGAVLTLSTLNLAGNYTTTPGATVNASGGIKTGAGTIADPYSGISVPTYSGCGGGTGKAVVHAASTQYLSPNVYCAGLSISSDANVVFNPGTYIIAGGSLSISGAAQVSGTGVTIVLTSYNGSYATVSISGGANVSLTAPTSGTFSGIAFYGDRNAPSGTSFAFSGGSVETIVGAIYAPTYSLNFSGGNTSASPCMQLLAHDMSFSGGISLNNNCSGVGTSSIGGSGVTQLLE